MTPGRIAAVAIVLLSLLTATFAGAAGGTAVQHERAGRTSVVTTELLRLEVPAGWSAREHDDRAGVTVTGQGAVLDVTLVPTVLFGGGLFLDVPEDATVATIADVVVPMFSPLDGVIADDARIVDLGDERPAVVLSVRFERGARALADRPPPARSQLGPNAVGEIVLFPADDGVLTIASFHSRGDARPVRDSARSILASLELTATADDVLTVLDPPIDELPGR